MTQPRAGLQSGGRLTIIEDASLYCQDLETLHNRETIFRVAAEHSTGAIFEWDTKTDRLKIHGPGRLGLADDEVPESFAEWCRRIHPADLLALNAAIGNHYQTGKSVIAQCRISRNDGSESVLEVRGSALWNNSGDGSTWIGVVTDVTAKLKSEEALSQLAAIVQSSDEAIVGCDLECRIVSWNMGAERLYGYSAGEAIGQPLSLVVPERLDHAVAELEPKGTEAAVKRMESVHLTRTGPCPVSLSISPVLRKDGRLTGFSLISHDISERKRHERKLLHQALHDALTGLPNRRLLRQNLQHCLSDSARHGRMVGVFFIDIDGFKTINDTLGHTAGDQLLRSVAARLHTCARGPDMLSRAGGDEFVLTAGGLHSRHAARRIAARLLDCMRQPFLVGGNQFTVAASIGVSLSPDDCRDADSLLRNADDAMYEAKRNGGNQVQFFSPALSDSLRTRTEIAGGLRLALDRNEFDLHFQPVFSAASTRVVRFESLLRWRPASAAEIAPASFIPVSEETGCIVPIGKWVLREACRRAAAWQSGPHRGIGVSVNISAVQLARTDFISTLSEALAESGLDANLLELELTESIFVNNPREAARTIASIHDLGVTMALDDFGTGYSSLSYLQNLPMDALKIDKSFLAEIELNSASVALIRSLASLAHSLGMRVVVEGVETRKQLELVSAAGCDELQGFLLGKPCAEPFECACPNALEMLMAAGTLSRITETIGR